MNENIRITLFIGSLTGGGAERVTANLANFLYENGNKVDVITMSDIKDTYLLNEGINRIYLLKSSERKNKLHDLKLRFKRLKEYVVKNKDVKCYIVMLPITIFMLILLKRYIKGKIIISERNNPSSYSIIEKLIMKYSARKCDGLVVQTKKIGEWYKTNSNKIVIPNAINNNILLDRAEIKLNKIVAVGRLDKQKNYPMLIKAFEIFSMDFPEYILEIYGSGKQEKKIKKMVSDRHLTDKVIFKGYVQNVSDQIKDAAMYVITSNFEGMPNSLIEAMCMGLPCISTKFDGGAAEELIENNVNGILIDKNDIKGLVSAMIEFNKSSKKTKKIGDNAQKILYTLSYDTIYSKWKEYINEILFKKG